MRYPLSDVQTETIGENTRIWQFVVILPGARIGSDCNICAQCFIENDVVIGDNVTIKPGVQLWDGLRIEDDVFIGPNVTFTNDPFPRSKVYPDKFSKTTVKKGASIGANATILPGLVIGTQAMVGAGAVVTHNVPPRAIVVGNPARIVGYVDTQAQHPVELTQTGKRAEPIVRGVRLHEIKHVTDLRGDLSVTELEKDVPFQVKRVFWVYNVPNSRIRGEHVHCELHEFVICVKGSISVVVDDGKRREEYLLDQPWLGLYLPPRVWRTLYKCVPDTVLLVFASHEYDPNDYIRDYDDFMRIVQESR